MEEGGHFGLFGGKYVNSLATLDSREIAPCLV